jgi:hypothetical protein
LSAVIIWSDLIVFFVITIILLSLLLHFDI